MKKVMGIIIALVCAVGLSSLAMEDDIFQAIEAKDRAKVKAMLEKDKSLATKKDKVSESYPLFAAAEAGDLEIVKLLVEAGADVNAKNNGGRSALYQAVITSKDIVKYLIDKGADVKAAELGGITPLHECLMAGENSLEIAGMLIAAGADVNALTEDGYPPLFRTETEKQARLMVEKGADLTKITKDGYTALHHFSKLGAIDLVKKCLELKMDPNGVTLECPAPLLIAAAKGHLEVVKILIDAGADPKAKHGDGENALHAAAISGNVELAKLLLEKGVDLNAATTDDKVTPLYLAINDEKKEMVKFLVEKGANLNAIATVDKAQITPLILAVDKENLELVKLLVDKGANPALAVKWDGEEVNAVDIALSNGNKEAVALFESKGFKPGPEKKVVKMFKLRALQAEAKTNLGALFIVQGAYYGEYSTYASGEKAFELLGWSPEGDTRYSYFVDKGVIDAIIGGPYAVPKEAGEPKSSKDTFIIYAVSNLDDDPTLDVWTMDANKKLVNLINDVEK